MSAHSEFNDLDGQDNIIDPECNFINKITKDSNYFTDTMLTKTLNKRKGFSIIHFNARSLNANFQNIELYLSQLEVKFDVVAISETWFNDYTSTNVFNMKGYVMHYVSRSAGKGGGVAIYVNSNLKCKKIESKSLCMEENFECVTMDISLDGSKNVMVACTSVYTGNLGQKSKTLL